MHGLEKERQRKTAMGRDRERRDESERDKG